MSAEVWYRKWRPQTFADVVGQDHVTRTLARAVELNRVAHAYLFCGPRGTGKTSTARILAKAVNCERPAAGQPCQTCASCAAVAAGRALDLVEMDAASNRGIDDIRRIRDTVGYSPNSSPYKVYLIDEVHELTAIAFDALLKTLEEPPPHVIFVLATTERHRVPETILSRCQVFDFVRIKLSDALARLRHIAEAEGVETSDAVLALIARRATGSLRDGENLFEQAVATHGRILTEEMVRGGRGGLGDARANAFVALLMGGRLAETLDLIAAVRDDGVDLRQFTRDAVQTLRSVLLLRAGAAASLDVGDDGLAALRAIASSATTTEVVRVLRLLCAVDFRADPQSPLPLELAAVECIEAPRPAPARAAPGAVAPGRNADAPSPAAAAAAATLSPAERARAVTAPRTGPPPEPLVARRPEPVTAPNLSGGKPAEAPRTMLAGEAKIERPEAAAAHGANTEQLTEVQAEARAGEPGVDEVRRRFREIYTRLSELDRNTAPLLNGGCDIVRIEGSAVVLGFQHKAHMDRALRKESLTFVRQAVSETLGRDVQVRCEHVPEVANRLQLLAAERPSHLVDEALRLGATPVERG